MLRSKKEKNMNWYKQQSTKNLKEADLVLKTLATLDPLLNLVDDIESTNIYKHELKRAGKTFKKELEKSLGVVFNTTDQTQSEAFWVMDQVDQLDDLITNTHISKFPDLIKLLQRFHELEGADTDTFIKSVVNRQYATINEFVLPAGIISKLREVVPMLDSMPLLQLSQQLPKSRAESIKGLGEQSIRILNEVFATSGIVW
jgi:hypothetical protein